MMRNLKELVKASKKIIYLKLLAEVLEFIYLFFRFRVDYFETSQFLRSRWSSIEDSLIPIENIRELHPPNTNFFVYNPTVIQKNGKLYFYARMSNRSYLPRIDFRGRSKQRNRETKSFDGICSFNLDIEHCIENFEVLISPSPVPSLQDPKAFVLKNNEVVLFVNYLIQEPFGSNRITMIRNAYLNTQTMSLKIFDNINYRNIEKNWIPFKFKDDCLTLLYESKPLTIIEYNVITNNVVFKKLKSEIEFNYHGGSQFVEIDSNTFVRVARYKFRFPYLGLISISFIVVHNKELEIKHISKPFIFRKFGHEMCNGLTKVNDRLIFAWGEDDYKMFTGSMKISDFLSWVSDSKVRNSSNLNIFRRKIAFFERI